MLSWVHIAWAGFELMFVLEYTDCIGSYKSNYHAVTTTTTLYYKEATIEETINKYGVCFCLLFDIPS